MAEPYWLPPVMAGLPAHHHQHDGQRHQRAYLLLVKYPKMAACTLATVALIAAVAAGCTFAEAQDAVRADNAVIYELGDGLILAIPADNAEKQREPSFPRGYHRAGYEAGIEDFGSPMGFLFNLFREEQVEYEQTYLSADGSTGQLIFARDDQWYYGCSFILVATRAIPTAQNISAGNISVAG